MATNDPRQPRRISTSGMRRTAPSGIPTQPTAPQAGRAHASGDGNSPRGGRRKKKRGVWGVIARIVAALFCFGVIAGCILSVVLSMYVVKVTEDDADLLNLDDLKLSQTTILYAKDHTTGNYIEYATLSSEYHRIWADLGTIPDDLKWAFICTEDKDFYTEPGINITRTVGAAVNELTHNMLYGSRQGASTLEQQLIKNITGDDDTSKLRKVREIFRAIGLCHRYSKDTVLEAYLNTISLTGTIAGVQAGAQEYFGKDVGDCSLQECATIAAITKNPTRYNPYTNPEELLTRRNDILYFMYNQNKIKEDAYLTASNAPLILVEKNSGNSTVTKTSNNSYFTDAVFKQLVSDIMEKDGCSEEVARNLIYTGGLRVYCTVDPFLQQTMEELMLNADDEWFPAYWHEDEVSELSDDDIPIYNEDGSLKTGTDSNGNTVYFRNVRTQAAMVTMNYEGEVLAMVGGIGEKTMDLSLNRVTEAPRQTGSSMKPLAAYSLALEYGAINYSSPVPDMPFYTAADKKVLNVDYCRSHGYSTTNIYAANALADPAAWRDWPSNYSGTYFNTNVLVPYALANSLNTVAVWVGSYVGADNMFSFAHDTLGMEHLTADDADYGPIVLGSQTHGVTPLELCAAYQIFNGGKYTTPYLYTEVDDFRGNVYFDKINDISSTQAISEETATIMNRLLRGVLVDGTASGLTPAGGLDAVAKTGTTTDYRDYTFAGLTPYYVSALWWGCDQPTSMLDLGARSGKPMQLLWKQYMETVQDGLEHRSFQASGNVIQAAYCADTGLLSNGACPNTALGYYTEENMPAICTAH